MRLKANTPTDVKKKGSIKNIMQAGEAIDLKPKCMYIGQCHGVHMKEKVSFTNKLVWEDMLIGKILYCVHSNPSS